MAKRPLSGEALDEKGLDSRLWFTYAHNSVRALRDLKRETKGRNLICDDENSRLTAKQAAAIRLILHSAMMLEYRMKRVLEKYGGMTADQIEDQQVSLDRLLGKHGKAEILWGKLGEPKDWPRKELGQLRNLRNKIAHGNWKKVVGKLGKRDFVDRSVKLYAAAVNAVNIMNRKTGYDEKGSALAMLPQADSSS